MAKTTWEGYAESAQRMLDERRRLDKAADDTRCPYVLTANGREMPYAGSGAFRCVRDLHDDVDHELAGGAWAHPDSIKEGF